MILVLGVGVFIVVEMYKAYQNFKADIAAGKKTFMDVLLAPWTALQAAWSVAANSSVGQGVSAAVALPGLETTETNNAAVQQTVAAGYQPGGAMYNSILATQGQAAADNAAVQAQQNADTESAQAVADSSWSTSPWNPATWFHERDCQSFFNCCPGGDVVHPRTRRAARAAGPRRARLHLGLCAYCQMKKIVVILFAVYVIGALIQHSLSGTWQKALAWPLYRLGLLP